MRQAEENRRPRAPGQGERDLAGAAQRHPAPHRKFGAEVLQLVEQRLIGDRRGLAGDECDLSPTGQQRHKDQHSSGQPDENQPESEGGNAVRGAEGGEDANKLSLPGGLRLAGSAAAVARAAKRRRLPLPSERAAEGKRWAREPWMMRSNAAGSKSAIGAGKPTAQAAAVCHTRPHTK